MREHSIQFQNTFTDQSQSHTAHHHDDSSFSKESQILVINHDLEYKLSLLLDQCKSSSSQSRHSQISSQSSKNNQHCQS